MADFLLFKLNFRMLHFPVPFHLFILRTPSRGTNSGRFSNRCWGLVVFSAFPFCAWCSRAFLGRLGAHDSRSRQRVAFAKNPTWAASQLYCAWGSWQGLFRRFHLAWTLHNQAVVETEVCFITEHSLGDPAPRVQGGDQQSPSDKSVMILWEPVKSRSIYSNSQLITLGYLPGSIEEKHTVEDK